MKKAILKDKMLAYLINRKDDLPENFPRLSQIAAHMGLDVTYATVLAQEIDKEGDIIYTPDIDPILKIKNNGEVFLTVDGGYKKLTKKSFKDRHPTVHTILMSIFGAIIAVVADRLIPKK